MYSEADGIMLLIMLLITRALPTSPTTNTLTDKLIFNLQSKHAWKTFFR
jgi:hypothetical protein